MAEPTQNPEDQFQAWLNSQSGYTGKTAKAQWWNDYNTNTENQSRLGSLLAGETPGLGLSGSATESKGRLEGLERAKILTGQDPYQIGKDYQQAYGNIQKRVSGNDTGSELLRANKAGAVADARNQMQQQGVKGGAALGAVAAVERAKAYDVNNQLQQSQRQAEMDYLNATKANANFTQASEMNYGAMAAGREVKPPSSNSGGMSTVICTELYRQGYYSEEIYKADQIYGLNVITFRPDIYRGYRFLADPIVTKMQKSKEFTKLVAFLAVPWARNMAGDKNLLGTTLSFFGEPFCLFVGKLIKLGVKHAN